MLSTEDYTVRMNIGQHIVDYSEDNIQGIIESQLERIDDVLLSNPYFDSQIVRKVKYQEYELKDIEYCGHKELIFYIYFVLNTTKVE